MVAYYLVADLAEELKQNPGEWMDVCRHLAEMAREGHDIGSAESALLKIAHDDLQSWPEGTGGSFARTALLQYYLKKEDYRGLESVLWDVQAPRSSLRFIRELNRLAHLDEADIRPALPLIYRMMQEGTEAVAREMAEALVYYHIWNGDPAGLHRHTQSTPDSGAVREGIEYAIPRNPVFGELGERTFHQTIREYWSLPKLIRLEQAIERYAAWLVNRPIGPHDLNEIAQHSQQQTAMSIRLQYIAEHKASLAKQRDGELLMGETMPKPASDGRRMYRVLTRRL